MVLAVAEHVPDQDDKLARHGDRCDVVAAPGSDPFMEGAQRPRRADGLPRCLDQQMARIGAPAFGNTSVVSRSVSGLSDTWIEADVGDQFLRRREPVDAPEPGRSHHSAGVVCAAGLRSADPNHAG